jgi:hypothetical protein
MATETFSIATKDGETKMLQRDVVYRLCDSLRGRLVTHGNDGYDSGRRV